MRVTVQDVMTDPKVIVASTTTVQTAIELIIREGVSEIYVNDDTGRLVGVVPDYELLKASLTMTPGSLRVERLISQNLVTVPPETPLDEIAPLFRDGRYSRVAVVQDGRLTGHIGRRDILRHHHAAGKPGRAVHSVAQRSHADARENGDRNPASSLPKPCYLKQARSPQHGSRPRSK